MAPNGAQPLPRPDGSLVVVYAVGAAEDDEEGGGEGYRAAPLSAEVLAATSLDGGATFGTSVHESRPVFRTPPGLRAPPLPSADVSADGRFFVSGGLPPRPDLRVAIGSCSRRRRTDSRGRHRWRSALRRKRDQFVPGLGADPATSGIGHGWRSSTTAAEDVRRRVDCLASTSGSDLCERRRDVDSPRRLDARPMQLDWLPLAEGDSSATTSRRPSSPAGRCRLLTGGDAVGGKLRQAIMATVPSS